MGESPIPGFDLSRLWAAWTFYFAASEGVAAPNTELLRDLRMHAESSADVFLQEAVDVCGGPYPAVANVLAWLVFDRLQTHRPKDRTGKAVVPWLIRDPFRRVEPWAFGAHHIRAWAKTTIEAAVIERFHRTMPDEVRDFAVHNPSRVMDDIEALAIVSLPLVWGAARQAAGWSLFGRRTLERVPPLVFDWVADYRKGAG